MVCMRPLISLCVRISSVTRASITPGRFRSARRRRRRPPYLRRVAELKIITLPDKQLRVKSAPVERVDNEVRRFMDDMLETMYAAPGIGLAAVQVNVPRRMIVLDVAKREDENAEPQ